MSNRENGRRRNGLGNHDLPLYFFRVTMYHAKRRGLCFDDSEDCALEFVEGMLLQKQHMLEDQQEGDHFKAWLHHCARNHTEDYRRRLACVRQHEVGWPEQDKADGKSLIKEPRSRNAAPEAEALRGELMSKVMTAAERLALEPRALFLCHYLYGETLIELSAATGRTRDAVGKVLKRACANIRATLTRQGMTEADVDEYLVEMRKRGGRRCHDLHDTRFLYIKFSYSRKSPVGFLRRVSLKRVETSTCG